MKRIFLFVLTNILVMVTVNIVLMSTPKQFSGISLGMNLLIYLMGASVGRGVVLRSICFTDFDLLAIGDNSVIGDVSITLKLITK